MLVVIPSLLAYSISSYREDGVLVCFRGLKNSDLVPLVAHSQKVPHQELSRYLPLRLLSPNMPVLLYN